MLARSVRARPRCSRFSGSAIESPPKRHELRNDNARTARKMYKTVDQYNKSLIKYMRGVGKLKQYGFSAASTALGKPGCTIRTSTGHTLATDLPTGVGGLNEAAQPVELLLAALLGCKTATAHFVARHLWKRPHNKVDSLIFHDIVAERDERGALTLPIFDTPPVTSALLSVRGVVIVRPASADVITALDVAELGKLVEVRCPVAATLKLAGCKVDFDWRLEPPH